MTSFSTIIDMFMHRVEEDKRFFNYYGMTDEEFEKLSIKDLV